MARAPADDLGITMDELRLVTRYVLVSADEILPVFEAANREDPRPRAAVDAARLFVDGAARSRLQRVTSLAAHRAAREVDDEQARCAARAAGDAAAAAYLHPPEQVRTWTSARARETQVGHVLRAAAHAARVAELRAGDDHGVGARHVEQSFRRASPGLVDVVRRYPRIAAGRNRVAQLTSALDELLRQP
ncbi:putative immunity protein [Pseudonocardia nematodicida]|uniref:Immunity protein n=1 Tax=Pseudonocardia nematodicida TaxID=1206997 RepID=A0ABV1KEP1_9PSEU